LSEDGRIILCDQLPPIKISHPVMRIAGPPILQQAAEECFCNKSNSELFNFAQVVCVSDEVSCQMKGNVRHDYRNEEYLRGLEQMAIPHYDKVRLESSGLRKHVNRFVRHMMRN
jgi:hypothetical protein